MLTPELRHASALPDLPTYLTCPALTVLCPPSVSCSRLIGPRSYPCLCPAPSTPAKLPNWPSEPALIALLLPIPFDAVASVHPTTQDAESLAGMRYPIGTMSRNDMINPSRTRSRRRTTP